MLHVDLAKQEKIVSAEIHEVNVDTSLQREQLVGQLQEISSYVRRDGFEMVLAAESGHLGGSSSSVELLTCLYFGGQFHFNPEDDKDPGRDRVLIRGHEGPVRYPIFALMGYLDRDELGTYRRYGSRLQGHEDMHVTPGVDITPSGSLGMLLSYGIGAATEIKRSDNDERVIVFLGDGEEQEGNVSEAARFATSQPLDNLICIIDQNTKQLSGGTEDVDSNTDLRKVWEGYGWKVKEIENANDVTQVLDMYDELQHIDRPTMVIAHTTKGIGLAGAEEHFSGYHTLSVCPPSTVKDGIDLLNEELSAAGGESVAATARKLVASPRKRNRSDFSDSRTTPEDLKIELDESHANNLDYAQFSYFKSYSEFLERHPELPFYVLTPDFLRKDYVDQARFREYAHYFDTGIREQHTIAMAHGISTENPDARIFINYGDAFLYRALDQINAAAQGGSNMLIAGEYAGISQAQNGKTHQSMSQPGALMHIPEVQFYEPADVRDLYNIFNHALGTNNGLTYVRLHPKNIPLIDRPYGDQDNFESYVAFEPDVDPVITMVSSGMTVDGAINASKRLERDNKVGARVVSVVSPKTLDTRFVNQLVPEHPILAVYNGNPEILRSQVASALCGQSELRFGLLEGHGFTRGTTGTIPELEKFTGLDADGIALRALAVLRS